MRVKQGEPFVQSTVESVPVPSSACTAITATPSQVRVTSDPCRTPSRRSRAACRGRRVDQPRAQNGRPGGDAEGEHRDQRSGTAAAVDVGTRANRTRKWKSSPTAISSNSSIATAATERRRERRRGDGGERRAGRHQLHHQRRPADLRRSHHHHRQPANETGDHPARTGAQSQGEPLGSAALIESQQRLTALGLFRRVRITAIQHGSDPSRDVVVRSRGGAPRTPRRMVPVWKWDRTSRTTSRVQAEEQVEFVPRGSFEIGRRNMGGKNRSINFFTRVSLRQVNQVVVDDNGSGWRRPAPGSTNTVCSPPTVSHGCSRRGPICC